MTTQQRFWNKVIKGEPTDCWPWDAAKTPKGYGVFAAGSRTNGSRQFVLAHRFAYEAQRGPIELGKQIDHLCRNKKCVNPTHLEVVTSKVNTLRGNGLTAINARKTHCKRGHPFDLLNTSIRPSGSRACRQCWREDERRKKEVRADVETHG